MIFAVAMLALGSGLGGGLLAQTDGEIVILASDEEGALPLPDAWRCDVIEPEYRAFLAAGKDPADFRFAGRTYRNVETGAVYSWDEWLAWRSRTACGKAAAVPADRVAIGAALGVLGAGVLVASNGANAKSPG